MKEATFDLVCDLDDDELRERGNTLSSTALEYDKVEAEKKDVMKGFSESLKSLRGEIRKLSGIIRRKQETRPVLCFVEFHSPVVGTKRISRKDTGEFVRDEAMSAQECQANMFEKSAVN
jgi:hypothetical protein